MASVVRSGRQQFRYQVTEEICATGWNTHRYPHSAYGKPSPAFVGLSLLRFGDDEHAAFETGVHLTPALARRLAAALIAAAADAEQAPPTDDAIVDPEAR